MTRFTRKTENMLAYTHTHVHTEIAHKQKIHFQYIDIDSGYTLVLSPLSDFCRSFLDSISIFSSRLIYKSIAQWKYAISSAMIYLAGDFHCRDAWLQRLVLLDWLISTRRDSLLLELCRCFSCNEYVCYRTNYSPRTNARAKISQCQRSKRFTCQTLIPHLRANSSFASSLG